MILSKETTYNRTFILELSEKELRLLQISIKRNLEHHPQSFDGIILLELMDNTLSKELL